MKNPVGGGLGKMKDGRDFNWEVTGEIKLVPS